MALIPEDIISQVIDRCDIVEVIASYIPLKKTGKSFKAVCPFHNEKTPSFVVHSQKQIFHCFGCDAGGNVVSFIMKHERLEFPEAIRLLAQRVNIVIPEEKRMFAGDTNDRQNIFNINKAAADYFHQNLLFGKKEDCQQAREYLKTRGVILETVKNFRLGFASNEWDGLLKHLKSLNLSLNLIEKAGLIISRENKEGFYDRFRNRIMFPIYDLREQCRGFGGRTIESSSNSDDKLGAKYINSPETPVYTKGEHLYGFHLAKSSVTEDEALIIVEGYMDCVVPVQYGVRNIVASLGTALTVDQIRLLRRYTNNVVMLFDGDAAGESAMLRSFDLLIEEDMNVKVMALPKGDDPDTFIKKHGLKAFEESLKASKSLIEFKFEALCRRFDIQSIEGKARVADEMLSTIDKFNNQVIKQEYLKWLSGALAVSEYTLNSQLVNLKSRVRKSVVVEEKPKEISAQPLKALEVNFLKLLLDQDDFVVDIRKEVELGDFTDERIRSVISLVFESLENKGKVNVSSLIDSLSDQHLKTELSRSIVKDENIVGDKKKMFVDYVTRIKSNRLKSRTEQLRSEIKKAEGSGDHQMLGELLKEFNELIRK